MAKLVLPHACHIKADPAAIECTRNGPFEIRGFEHGRYLGHSAV